MSTDREDIVVTALPTGAAVTMPYDAARLARFKVAFPKARWGAATQSWHIAGPLAVARAERWRASEYSEHRFDPWARARALDALAFDPLPPSAFVRVSDAGIEIELPYSHRHLVAALRSIGARFNAGTKRWTAPATARAGAVEIIAQLPPDEGRSAPTSSYVVWHALTERFMTIETPPHRTSIHEPGASTREIVGLAKRDALAEWMIEDQARADARTSRRDLRLVTDAPAIGSTAVRGGRTVVYTSLGKPFPLGARHMLYDASLIAHLGEAARYCYWIET